MVKISAVIPAFNEENRIESVLKKTQGFVDEIIVIDDASTDNTAMVAKGYARVLRNKKNMGYIYCIKKGFKAARNEIIVTLDADGEHDPSDIPRLVKPLVEKQGDLVLGIRENIPRVSERFICWVTNFKVKTKDCGTGFRAIRKNLAVKLSLCGKCTCGIFVLETFYYNARVVDVTIKIRKTNKKRKIAYEHFIQIFYIIRFFFN